MMALPGVESISARPVVLMTQYRIATNRRPTDSIYRAMCIIIPVKPNEILNFVTKIYRYNMLEPTMMLDKTVLADHTNGRAIYATVLRSSVCRLSSSSVTLCIG